MNLIWQLFIKFKSQIIQGLAFIFFGIFIIAILAQFTNFPKVLELISKTPGNLNFLLFGFLAAYYLIKFQLERFLISKLNLKVTFKRIVLLFAIAELVREFPTVPIVMGITATTKAGQRFFPMKLFSALTPQLPMEIASCFLILALFGFGNLPFLQLASFLVVVLIFILLLLLKKVPVPKFLLLAKTGLKQKIAKALLDLKSGFEQILVLKNLIISFLFIVSYILLLSTVLYFVGQAAGFEQFKLTQSWSTFSLIYIALVFSPIPADWGVSESSGFVLLSFLGAEREAALAVVLTFRIIFTSITWLVSGVIFWFLWSEIRDFLRGFANLKKN